MRSKGVEAAAMNEMQGDNSSEWQSGMGRTIVFVAVLGIFVSVFILELRRGRRLSLVLQQTFANDARIKTIKFEKAKYEAALRKSKPLIDKLKNDAREAEENARRSRRDANNFVRVDDLELLRIQKNYLELEIKALELEIQSNAKWPSP
jgi:hypothetical protein